MELWIIFLVFAAFGVAQEVLFTGIIDSAKKKNPRLLGRSTIWMFPIYGCIMFIVIFVVRFFGSYPWYIRGIFYSALILALEYASGFLIRTAVGVAPWDYSTDKSYDNAARKKRFSLHGLICLEYAPIWFIGGLLAERLYLFLLTL
jgi:uncharacterized membrane protein